MAICPNCKKKFAIPEKVILHMGTYGEIVNTVTECCNVLVECTPQITYKVKRAMPQPFGDETEGMDTWGVTGKYLKEDIKFFE